MKKTNISSNKGFSMIEIVAYTAVALFVALAGFDIWQTCTAPEAPVVSDVALGVDKGLRIAETPFSLPMWVAVLLLGVVALIFTKAFGKKKAELPAVTSVPSAPAAPADQAGSISVGG